jgi:GTPase SAR1 family protein
MSSTDSKILMLGLRGSGKTTFLAALWHFLESAEITDRLELPQLQPDRDYLNLIRNNWLSVKPVGRTSLRTKATVSLSLRDKKTDREVELLIPDLSGESFRLQWSTRKAPAEYVSFARECTAAFLFVHPSEVKRTHAIKAASDEKLKDDDTSLKISSAPNWSAERTSTQVQLVDIVQLLLRMREAPTALRMAVVVSAWDLIKARVSPLGWLDSRLPLLSQFLRANQNCFASETFGVSAQGGDLVKDHERLLQNTAPSSRCIAVKGENIDPVPITAPLQFLLNAEPV